MIQKLLKVAIYARVSTEEQTENFSLAAQIELLKKYAYDHGMQVHREYIDGGFSGTTMERPAFQEMMDDARNNCFEMILVYRLDRFFRNNRALLTVVDELDLYKVSLKSITEPFDTSNHIGKFLLSLLGSLAQLERDSFIERSRMGKIRRAKEGNYSGTGKFGYRLSEDGKKLLICPKESEIVKLMFNLYIEPDSSLNIVAKKLNNLGYRSRKGNEFRNDTIHEIISDPIYIGEWYSNRWTKRGFRPKDEWIPVKVPAFISEDVFQRARDLLNKRRNYVDKRKLKYEYLLSGFIKCGDCGHNVRGTVDRQYQRIKGKYYGPYLKSYYRCSHFFKNKLKRTVNCNLKYLQAEPFEAVVWKEIESLLTNPNLIDKAIEKEKSNFSTKKIEAECSKIESQIRKLQNEDERLLKAYQESVIDLNQLKVQVEKINETKRVLKARLGELSELTIPKADDQKLKAINYVDKVKKGLEKLTFENKKKVLEAFQTRIVANVSGVLDIFCTIPTLEVKLPPNPNPILFSFPPSGQHISWPSAG